MMRRLISRLLGQQPAPTPIKRTEPVLAAPQVISTPPDEGSVTPDPDATAPTIAQASHPPVGPRDERIDPNPRRLDGPPSRSRADHLGRAAKARHAAEGAVSVGDYDAAWRLYHEEKDHLARHALKCGFKTRDTVCLDAGVSENLANVLRLEGRHIDALTHILYWITASRHRPIKRHQSKLEVYLKRTQLDVTLEAVNNYIYDNPYPSFREIQRQVAKWQQRPED